MHRTRTQTKSAQRRTIRATTLFVVFVCLSLLAVNGWLAWRGRDQQMSQAVVSNTNLAAAVAQQMDGMFSEVGYVLDSIAYEMELSSSSKRLYEHVQPLLKNHADSNQHIHGIFIYDTKGGWVISSQGASPANANNADREYFIRHRENPSLVVWVGKPIVSRSSGIWVIPVSRRLNNSEGIFAGVVIATIDLAHVSKLLADYQIGKQGALNITQANTAILVRRPFSVESLGKEMVASAMKQQVISHTSGNFEIISPIDGVERVASFQRMQNHPLLVTVALSKREMLREWRETTWIQTLWIVLLCAITAVAGTKVIALVRKRMTVELDLGETRDQLTKANERLAKLASYDGLTGLANRRSFDETLERDFAESCRSGQPLSLVMIDVDHFKQYNDVYGHPEGDRCLQQVAHAIESAARRPLDFVARYGGEEMVMVLPNTNSAGAFVVAEMARSAVEALAIPHSSYLGQGVTVSIGVATQAFDKALQSTKNLVQHADEALYQAKAAGRNCVVAYAA